MEQPDRLERPILAIETIDGRQVENADKLIAQFTQDVRDDPELALNVLREAATIHKTFDTFGTLINRPSESRREAIAENALRIVDVLSETPAVLRFRKEDDTIDKETARAVAADRHVVGATEAWLKLRSYEGLSGEEPKRAVQFFRLGAYAIRLAAYNAANQPKAASKPYHPKKVA